MNTDNRKKLMHYSVYTYFFLYFIQYIIAEIKAPMMNGDKFNTSIEYLISIPRALYYIFIKFCVCIHFFFLSSDFKLKLYVPLWPMVDSELIAITNHNHTTKYFFSMHIYVYIFQRPFHEHY